MPPDPAAALSSLLRSSTIQDHDEILHAANAALKANKNDLASQHVRVVALLSLNRFDDALRSIAAGGTELEAACALEKAYALYKTNGLEEATAALGSDALPDRSLRYVAAQVAYRSERFDEALAIYKELSGEGISEEENDLNINIMAALAQSVWQDSSAQAHSTSEPTPDTFMLCYNSACIAIARGALNSAASLLQRAIRLCDASEDLAEEDKRAEMRPILAQQAYVYARLGKAKEALDLYQSLGSTEDNDPDFTVVAANNLSTIETKPANPFLLQRKAASWVDAGQKAKLFGYQSNLLARNISVIDLQAHKLRGVQERTEKLLAEAKQPTTKADVNSLSVLNAAATTHGAAGKELARDLRDLSKKRPSDIGLVLSMVQVLLEKGRDGAALTCLESFLHGLDDLGDQDAKDVRFSPGLIALAVSLMRAKGHQSAAKAELVKAARHWKDLPSTSATSLLREAGIELSKSSKSEDLSLAGSAFEKILDEDQGSHIAAAGLVASLAASDPAKIQQHVAELPPVETLIQGVDTQELINAGVAAASHKEGTKKREAPQEVPGRSAKRRRKMRLPKNYEEGKAPDPERWLPLRDRSTYRPKGKKGKKKAAESTQGGVVKEEETLGLVGGGGVKVERASGGQSSNKKKKKGKK